MSIATEAGGLASIRFIYRDQLPALVADAREDEEAAHTFALLSRTLNDLDARQRGKRLCCFCCGKPIRRFPIVVLITAAALQPHGGLAGVIGHCCDRPEAELYARVIAMLNESIEGGMFHPWQFHEPGHA